MAGYDSGPPMTEHLRPILYDAAIPQRRPEGIARRYCLPSFPVSVLRACATYSQADRFENPTGARLNMPTLPRIPSLQRLLFWIYC